MSDKDDGGPAFPSDELWQSGEGVRQQFAGMTLRDYFAAAALSSVIQSWYRTDEEIVCAEEEDAECVAKIAYELADAMMKARNK